MYKNKKLKKMGLAWVLVLVLAMCSAPVNQAAGGQEETIEVSSSDIDCKNEDKFIDVSDGDQKNEESPDDEEGLNQEEGPDNEEGLNQEEGPDQAEGLNQAKGLNQTESLNQAESPDETGNLLPNGDFEQTDENGNATDWMAAGDTWGNGISLKTGDEAVSGEHYLSLKADKTIYIRQPLKNWSAGEYLLSAYAKVISGKARIKAEFYDKNYKMLSSLAMEWENNADWEKKEQVLTVPENTYLFSFMVRLENGGEVLFDHITITEEEDTGSYVNLLKNGGFETIEENGAASEWKPILCTWGETANIKTGEAAEGERYLSIAGTSAMYLVQSLHDWEAGEYAFSAKMKLLSGKAAIKAEYYNSSYQFLSADQFDYTTPTNNQWIKVKGTLKVPENTYLIHFMLRLTEGGEVWWDDVQVLDELDEEQLEAQRLGKEFRDMLAREASVSQMTEESNLVKDPYVGKPPMAGATELIRNGGFEDGLDEWDIFKEQFAPYSSLAEGEGRDGGNALKFTASAQQELVNALRHQIVKPVAGAEYQLSYWYKVNKGASVEPVVKMEFHGEVINDILTGYSEGWPYPENRTYSRDGEWHQVIYRVRIPDYTTELHLYPRIMRNVQEDQEILLDDISLYMTAAPTVMTLSTDDGFYYDDIPTAVFSAHVDTGYFPQYANADVTFILYDGQNPVWQSDGAKLDQGSVSVNCDLTGLSNGIPYCVKAILYDGDGREAAVKTTNIYKYSRPEYLTKDGIFMKNGTDAFAPVLAYHVSQKDYAKVAEAGINVVQMFNGDTFSTFSTAEDALKFLDAAQEAGIMGFLPLYNGGDPAGHDNNIERTIRVLNDERVINHPALFGYGICDEPYLRKVKQADLENSYRLIRQFDTKHPIMMVVAFAGSYGKGSNLVDILEIDPYGTAESGRAYIDTGNACAASGYRKPVYTLLGTYRYDSGRIPSAEEVRNNNWQALIGGAGAIGYYSIRDAEKDDSGRYTVPIWDAKDGGAMWNALIEWGVREKALAYDRFVFHKYDCFREELKEDFWYSSWETEDALYMVVLGRKTGQELPISIPLENLDGSKKYGQFQAKVISGKQADTEGNGALELTLNGIEAVLYEIKASSNPGTNPGEGEGGNPGTNPGEGEDGNPGTNPDEGEADTDNREDVRTNGNSEKGISPKTGETAGFPGEWILLAAAAAGMSVLFRRNGRKKMSAE